jgi:Fur family transcriptional regulator, iron response regulator
MVLAMTLPPAEILSEPSSSDTEPRLRPALRAGADSASGRDYKELLRQAGLRPTLQRMALGAMLFSQGDRHVTAEMLHDEAIDAKIPVSLATVYNTLNQFTEAGLLRQIGVDGSKSFFDTNPSEHHHFFIEDEDTLLDIPPAEALLRKLPQAPEGFEVGRFAVVVRLRRKQG